MRLEIKKERGLSQKLLAPFLLNDLKFTINKDNVLIYQIEKIVSFILVILTVLLTGMQVFFRYVLNSPLSWTEELARFALVWLVFWGSAIAIRRKRHLSIPFFVNLLPKKIKIYIDMFNKILIIVFLGILLYTGYEVMLETQEIVTPALGISYLWFYIIVPISCAFMLLQIAFIIFEDFKKIKG